jgi:pimeloyl-ACP methyl ester carboxylesterase
VTEFVDTADTTYAYRRIGHGADPPLVLCMRFRGTIDDWDPALLQPLSAERELIVFDNAGIGYSSGSTPSTIDEMAADALAFLDALGLDTIDLLGWSMGGFVAQTVALARPGLVRRLIVAGSGPGRVPNMPATPERVLQTMAKPNNDDNDMLYLFYPETEQARTDGIASLRRTAQQSSAVVSPEAFAAQIAAVTSFGTGVWDRLEQLTMPVLVANGAHDMMINSYASYAMSQRPPNARVILYSDAGHAFLFQHPDRFAHDVLAFLDGLA